MKNRSYLKGTILLREESAGAFPRKFTIGKVIGKGGFAVCYEAHHENSALGVLKEFYPKNAGAIKRDRSGQLFYPSDTPEKEWFEKEREAYLEPYHTLRSLQRQNSSGELSAFIPPFELYRGCDENGNVTGTAYIWTPRPALEAFDVICDEIHSHPEQEPEWKLVTVLSAMVSLTKCIHVLHNAGMLHRDIKPANFGFLKRGEEHLTQALSLFDVNSICSAFEDMETGIGTREYMEPESGYLPPSIQTDIYAIGAVLYHAVVVTPESRGRGYLFQREDYDDLRRLVDESRLIRASEGNSHPRLRNILTVILQKSLCERAHRYRHCGELTEDLEKALFYALPSAIARQGNLKEKGMFGLDANTDKNSSLALQYHLYHWPLYAGTEKDDPVLAVLLIGFGNYGQKFLDICLQAGQMRGKTLDVTVVSDDATDREIYLKERPELDLFFNIDGSQEGAEDPYGNVSFVQRSLFLKNRQKNSEVLTDILREYCDQNSPPYVFIALGEDMMNQKTARACAEAAGSLGMDCRRICYVSEEGHPGEEPLDGPMPVCVNADVRKDRLYPEMERMAFNAHLVWEKNLNVNFRKLRGDFRKRYNHDASVSNVLSVKYKLFSIGIDLDECGAQTAIARYIARGFSDPGTDNAEKNELICAEHRRWVAEKLCQGWTRIRNLEECMDGTMRDKKRKKHVCIVHSRPDQILEAQFHTGDNYDAWEQADAQKLAELDELDRMSVDLHRMFAKKAREIKNTDLLSGGSIDNLRGLVRGCREASLAFLEWHNCMKDIWAGDRTKVPMYSGLKDAFLKAAKKELSKVQMQAVNDQVKAFETLFYPLLETGKYRNYKNEDVHNIEDIPFILTYTQKIDMVIPYITGNSGEAFQNVAAAAVVNPDRIRYLYLEDPAQSREELKKSIPCVVQFMKKKELSAAVELVIAGTGTPDAQADQAFAEQMLLLGEKRIRHVKYIYAQDAEELIRELEEYLKRCEDRNRLFAVEKNTARLSERLQDAGVYRQFPNYSFDCAKIEFYDMAGCDMLRYIRKKPYITVTDAAAFRRFSCRIPPQPEFSADYRELWETCRADREAWRSLCALLGGYAQKNDLLASFRKKEQQEKAEAPTQLRYRIPFACGRNAAMILEKLTEQGIAEQGSRVEGCTTDSCEVLIRDRCDCKEAYDRLFSNLYALMLPDDSLHILLRDEEVRILFDDLTVRDVSIAGQRSAELAGLLDFFRRKNYIINLQITPDYRASFTYVTRTIKELMTAAEKILEIYIYHDARKLEAFDDVVSGLELEERDAEAQSRIDCVLTKGYRMLFVACKAGAGDRQALSDRMDRLVQEFGINATAVRIADMQEKPERGNDRAAEAQRRNGEKILTIWKPEEIENIGKTLLKIINGEYADS